MTTDVKVNMYFVGHTFWITEKLHSFLLNNNILPIFLINCISEDEKGTEEHPLHAIGAHFMWADTEEGAEFWDGINNLFDDVEEAAINPNKLKEVI